LDRLAHGINKLEVKIVVEVNYRNCSREGETERELE